MRALLVVAVALMGCGPARLPGAPEPGKACGESVPECTSAATVSICESGKWAEYDCPSSCSNNQAKRCDWTQARVGESCPKSFDGVGFVTCTATGTAAIGCRDGVFRELSCPNCRYNGATFSCF